MKNNFGFPTSVRQRLPEKHSNIRFGSKILSLVCNSLKKRLKKIYKLQKISKSNVKI